MIKLAIFDLDGTLVDSVEDLADAVNEALMEYGYPVHEKEKYYYFVGNGTLKLCERVLPETKRCESEINKIHDKFAENYNKCCLNKTKPYKKINEMLKTLKSKGIKCAVASNKTDEFTKNIVLSLFGKDVFDVIMGKCAGVPTKPDPQIVHNILEKLGYDKEETIYIGDSCVDVQTAHNSGLKCIGCKWGFRGEDELIKHGSDYIASEPDDIVNIISEME